MLPEEKASQSTGWVFQKQIVAMSVMAIE